MANKVLLDTTVLVDILRKGKIPGGYFSAIKFISSVTHMELIAGARGAAQAGLANELLRPFERANRIVIPGHKEYLLAGVVLQKTSRPPVKMFRDALIAACARKIGAELWTGNVRDFLPMVPFVRIRIKEV